MVLSLIYYQQLILYDKLGEIFFLIILMYIIMLL
jgi:hypothetical protein